MIRLLILILLVWFCLIDNTLIFGQDNKKANGLSVTESYKMITENKYVSDILNYKYADSTMGNFIKLNESFEKDQDYYEYWIFQEQPKIEKISKLLILRIDRFSKLISVYDTEKDLIIPLNEWIQNKK